MKFVVWQAEGMQGRVFNRDAKLTFSKKNRWLTVIDGIRCETFNMRYVLRYGVEDLGEA